MADEMKRIDVTMGPYRGNLLDLPAAEADAAIAAHWARDPYSTEEYGTGHDPLSEEERASAMAAAQTWAQAQWDLAQGTATPKEERDMTADASGESTADAGGEYTTRATRKR
jgi:hypothetical protein